VRRIGTHDDDGDGCGVNRELSYESAQTVT